MTEEVIDQAETPVDDKEQIAAVVDILAAAGAGPKRTTSESRDGMPETGTVAEPLLDQSVKKDPEAVSDDPTKAGEQTSDSNDGDDDDGWSMQELADEAGLDIKELYSTPVKFGEGRDSITLGEMKDFYDKNREGAKQVQTRLDALDEMKTRGEAARAAVNKYAPQAQQAQQRMDEISAKVNAVDWNNVPPEKQAQYQQYASDLQSGYDMAKMSLDNAQSAMADSSTQLAQIEQDEKVARQEEWSSKASEEWPKIVAMNPDWKTQELAVAGMNDLYKGLEAYGLSEMEARQVTDHRLFAVITDALKFKAAGNIDTKQVRKKTRNLGGKRPVPASVRSKRAKQRAVETARNGTEAEKIAAVSALIN